MAELGRKALLGSVFLILRQGSMNMINFLGNLILARILMPGDFGIYSIVLFVLTFLTLVGDGGLAAALIRKPGDVSDKDLSSVFTFQQMLMAALSLLFLTATFLLKGVVKNPDVLILFRVSIISYFLVAFRIVPVLILERNLLFGKIALLEVLETLSFQATAVVLALLGKGVWALIIGLLVKNAVTLLVLVFISPWKIKYSLDFNKIKHILPFGLSFQGVNFVNLIKDSFVPMWIGTVLGTASVGLITWAGTIVNYPLVAANIVSRVLFPMFAQLQGDKKRLSAAIELVLRASVLFVFGLSAVIWALALPLTKILYTDKWLPALVLFNFFIPISLISTIVGPLIAANNAVGRASYNFKFSIAWAVLLWLSALILVPKFGIMGFGIANLIVTLSDFVYFYDASKRFNIAILKNIFIPFACAGAVAIALKVAQSHFSITNLWLLILWSAAGLLVYACLALLFNGKKYLDDIRFIREKSMKAKQV
jgi:teichuronic acid exporter